MSRCREWRRAACAVILLLGFATTVVGAAVPSKRMPGSVGDMTSTWELSEQPATLWVEGALPAALSVSGPVTTVDPGATPASTFELVDVPPERLEATRELLSEFSARSVDGAIVIDLPGDVLFDFDQDTLRADALGVLARVSELLAGFPGRAVAINGHTDSKGSDAYNDALSKRRAERVHGYLLERVASPRQYSVRGFGEHEPVAPNEQADGSDNPQGRQKNRRVTIVIAPETP